MTNDVYELALARLKNFDERQFDPSVNELAALLRALLVERKAAQALCGESDDWDKYETAETAADAVLAEFVRGGK